jgi:hypothetical protein
VAGAKQRGKQSARGRRSREVSEGLVCKFRKFQGLLYKERTPVDTKS